MHRDEVKEQCAIEIFVRRVAAGHNLHFAREAAKLSCKLAEEFVGALEESGHVFYSPPPIIFSQSKNGTMEISVVDGSN